MLNVTSLGDKLSPRCNSAPRPSRGGSANTDNDLESYDMKTRDAGESSIHVLVSSSLSELLATLRDGTYGQLIVLMLPPTQWLSLSYDAHMKAELSVDSEPKEMRQWLRHVSANPMVRALSSCSADAAAIEESEMLEAAKKVLQDVAIEWEVKSAADRAADTADYMKAYADGGMKFVSHSAKGEANYLSLAYDSVWARLTGRMEEKGSSGDVAKLRALYAPN